MREFDFIIRTSIVQTIEAEDYFKAVEKLKETFREQPYVLDEINDCEIELQNGIEFLEEGE